MRQASVTLVGRALIMSRTTLSRQLPSAVLTTASLVAEILVSEPRCEMCRGL